MVLQELVFQHLTSTKLRGCNERYCGPKQKRSGGSICGFQPPSRTQSSGAMECEQPACLLCIAAITAIEIFRFLNIIHETKNAFFLKGTVPRKAYLDFEQIFSPGVFTISLLFPAMMLLFVILMCLLLCVASAKRFGLGLREKPPKPLPCHLSLPAHHAACS